MKSSHKTGIAWVVLLIGLTVLLMSARNDKPPQSKTISDPITRRAFYNGCLLGLRIRGHDAFDESLTQQCDFQSEIYATPVTKSLYRPY